MIEGPPVSRLVDAHVHFFDVDAGTGLSWEWAEGPLDSNLLPDLAPVRARRFLPPDLWAEGRRLGSLDRCVHVQASSERGDPLAETRWLAELRERYGAPHAAVARVALDEPDADRVLDGHCEFDWVRGVRDLNKTSLLSEPRYVEAVCGLARRDLLFEIVCGPSRFAALAELAGQCRATTIVLEHFGLPPAAPGARFDAWREGLATVAAHENVRFKLSGLALCDPGWDFDHAQRLVAAGLDAFGPGRCVVGSNFPIDRSGASYPDVVHAVARATADLSEAERYAVLAGNAEAIYRV